MKNKLLFVVILVIVLVCFTGTARAMTDIERQSLVSQLQAQIAQLIAQLQTLQNQQDQGQIWCHTFNKNLRFGDKGKEVVALHTALDKEGITYGEDANDTYDEGTSSAIVEFQEKYASEILVPLKLKHGTGNFGPTTRKKMNALYGCGIIPNPTQPSIVIYPTNLVQGQTYNFSGKLKNATPNSEIKFYLRSPDGTMQENGRYVGTTNSAGNFSLKTTQTIYGGAQSGTYVGWVIAGERTSNEVRFIVSSSSTFCTDSDGGTNYYVKGTTKGINDAMTGGYIEATDKCEGSILYEYVCTQTAPNNKYPIVVGLYKYTCPNGCLDGACIQSTTQPSITVTSPNGGETWQIGSTYNITWTSSAMTMSRIELVSSTSPSGARDVIASNVNPSSGSYSWTLSSALIPSIATGGLFKVVAVGYDQTGSKIEDSSNNYFSIVAPTVGTLDLVKYVGYPNQTTVAPIAGYKLSHFTLTNNTNEAINLATIEASLNSIKANTTNLYVKYGDNQTTVKTSISDVNTWSINSSLSIGQTISFIVYGDISSGVQDGVVGQVNLTVRGVGQNSASSFTTGNIAGQLINFTSSSIIASLDGSSPLNQTVAGGQEIAAAIFKFTAVNGSYTITEIKIAPFYPASSSAINSATLKDGSTILATAEYDSANNRFNFVGLNVFLLANSTKRLTLNLTLGVPSSSGINVKMSMTYFKVLNSIGMPTTSSDVITGNDIFVTPTITISLKQGWNLISIPWVLENNSIDNVFKDIIDKVIVINSFDNGAKTYDPKLPDFSDLHNIDYLHSYWVDMSGPANLVVSGTLPTSCSINLNSGWNMVSFLGKTEQNLTDALSSISGKYTEVKDDIKVWNLQLPVSVRLATMKPYKGYWINMSQPAVLIYPNNICSLTP